MTPEPPREQFGDHYRSIYLAGAGGELPSRPVDGRDLESAAAAALDDRAAGYVFGPAGTGGSERANRAALDAWGIVSRMPRDIAGRGLRVSPFGREWPAPLALAPVGAQMIVHPDGELASADGGAATGVARPGGSAPCDS